MKAISVTGHGNKNYCKANISCDQFIDENAEYTKRLGFTVKEKGKLREKRDTTCYVLNS